MGGNRIQWVYGTLATPPALKSVLLGGHPGDPVSACKVPEPVEGRPGDVACKVPEPVEGTLCASAILVSFTQTVDRSGMARLRMAA